MTISRSARSGCSLYYCMEELCGERRTHWLDLLVNAGLYLLDPIREHVADHIDTVSNRAKDVYEETSGRVQKASRASPARAGEG